RSFVTGEYSQQGASSPVGFFPVIPFMSSIDFIRTSSSCSGVISNGFSCEYPCTPISCPSRTILFTCSGNVSIECPGVNQVAFILYFLNKRSEERRLRKEFNE